MGIIGFGYMGKWHLKNAPRVENVSVVAAYDINPDIIGKDISTLIGGKEKGVLVESVEDLLCTYALDNGKFLRKKVLTRDKL